MTSSPPAWIVLGRSPDGLVSVALDADGAEIERRSFDDDALPGEIRRVEDAGGPGPRWVWSDTPEWYERLLDEGVRVARCHDLRLCHAILRDSRLVADAADLRAATAWDAAASVEAGRDDQALFALEDESPARPAGPPSSVAAALEEFARQREAIRAAADPGRLRLLCSAESAGALIASELRHAGLPWDAAVHDRILVDILGERPRGTGAPARIDELAKRVRRELDDPTANLDSQPKLLQALHRAGVMVHSTSRWELAEHEHPVIEPLIEYRRLSRLLTANGWNWLSEWVHDGRFRPVYVPAGVVTGRWASSGGGALQIPRQLRGAVRADPGWAFVVADVAQLEPRVLAAMARDVDLAAAARGRDLYAGVVESGAVSTRQEAKIALLGAMYGATTGDSGRLVPRLRRTYPRSMALVDAAARTGEDGGVVSTWLGRTAPAPSPAWMTAQSRASDADATEGDVTRARRWARDRGRFTRNFVVQGTAAEWALVWLGDLRARLAAFPRTGDQASAGRSGASFAHQAHLVFFLHDELIVHTPAADAERAADAVRGSAAAAAGLLFGGFPIDFPLDLRIARTAEKS